MYINVYAAARVDPEFMMHFSTEDPSNLGAMLNEIFKEFEVEWDEDGNVLLPEDFEIKIEVLNEPLEEVIKGTLH